MSLINKMLQDLEAREEPAPRKPQAVYQDLRPVGADRKPGSRRLLMALLGVLAVVAGLYLAVERSGLRPDEIPLVAALSPAAAPGSPPAAQTPPAPRRAVPPRVVERPVRPKPAPAAPAAPDPAPNAVVAAASPAKATAPAAPSAPASENKAGARAVKPDAPKPPVAQAAVRPPAPKPKVQRRTPPPAAASSKESAEVDIKVRPLTAQEQAEAAYRQGLRFFDQARPDDAMRELRKALVEDAKHVKARELAAGIALQTGHWREAQNLLEEGLRQVPSHYLFARLLARVYVDHGNEAKALAVMESAAPQGSDDAEFSALLGLLYQRAGRHADAVKTYERALQLQPGDGRTWLGFAISLEGTTQWRAARDAYQRARNSGLAPALAQYADQRLAALQGL